VRLQSFVKNRVQTCVKNVLAHIRVLALTVALENLERKPMMTTTWSPSRRLSLKLKIWPASSPRSLIFSSLLLMMKLTARLCSALAPPSSFVKIYFIRYLIKKLWLLWIHLYYFA
jgi:hypothetical protein